MKRRGFVRSFVVVACATFAAGVGWWLCAGRGGSAVRAAQASVDAGQVGKVPVLVELFTSEGCSSCPPADALLGRLDREQPLSNAKIIVLSEHVDYWNNGGWQDRFSSAALTERQNEYGDFFKLSDVYTPQMVVNGAVQMNGTDGKKIAAALEDAAVSHPIPLQITSVQVRGKAVSFTLRNGMPATPGSVDVYAALVDPEDTTKVGAGENHGRTLQHVGVVRVLDRVSGSSRTQDLGSKPLAFSGSVSGKPGFEGMRLVVFVQTKRIGPVLGADACLITSGEKADGGPVGPCPSAGAEAQHAGR
jgi:hypothetical protein